RTDVAERSIPLVVPVAGAVGRNDPAARGQGKLLAANLKDAFGGGTAGQHLVLAVLGLGVVVGPILVIQDEPDRVGGIDRQRDAGRNAGSRRDKIGDQKIDDRAGGAERQVLLYRARQRRRRLGAWRLRFLLRL